MLISGERKLERMRDGRAVYIGAERVDDVTSHPAFREGAQTVAGLYDLKADPAKRELFSFEEDGERISLYWLRCRTRDDLARRMRCCKAIADYTYGFVGRSPDQVSGLITGLAMNAGLLDGLHAGFGQNLLKYYDFARKNDLYLSFAVTPASGRKDADLFPGQQRDDPNLQVVAEDDAGVTVSGMKMLATCAVYADEILIGNLTPIDDKLQERGDHRGDAAQRAGPVAVVAPALRAACRASGRLSDVVPLRRDRQRAGLRQRQDSVGARVPAQRRRDVAAHLHRDAGELLPEPPVQHPVLGEDAPDRRPRQPHLPGQRHRQDSGGARDARPARRAGGADRRAGARPDRRLGELAGRLRHAEPPHHVCGAELVPGAPHRDHRHAAHACSAAIRW